MKRREVIGLGLLAPLIAALERAFGWLFPDSRVRGWRAYLDGAEKPVSLGDVSEIDFKASEPFSVSFWAKTPRGRDGALTTPGNRKKKIPKLRIKASKFLRRFKGDDGKWHHFLCRYDGKPIQRGCCVHVDV